MRTLLAISLDFLLNPSIRVEVIAIGLLVVPSDLTTWGKGRSMGFGIFDLILKVVMMITSTFRILVRRRAIGTMS